MNRQATAGLLRVFQGIPDPRARNARHLPSDILTIAILDVRCGADDWAAVESWRHGRCGSPTRCNGWAGASASTGAWRINGIAAWMSA